MFNPNFPKNGDPYIKFGDINVRVINFNIILIPSKRFKKT